MLLKHTSYNLLGLGIPLLAALVSIPMLIAALGEHRFGLLTLIWAVVSYFGLFDMGLGRALTKELSVVFARKDNAQIGPLVTTATILLTGLGILASLLLSLLAPWVVDTIEGVPDRQEALNAIYAMAFAMPAIVLTTCFRGVLEAKHAFGILNLIRLPMGLFTFLGPLGVVIYGQARLDWIAIVLVIGRVVACGIHAWYAWRALPSEHGTLVMRVDLIKPLCITGGWMTLSNIISPFMGYVDRFLIGSLASVSAVTYYVTPQELITKLSILPGALTAVLFPTFAAQVASRDDRAWPLFASAIYSLFLILLPITAVTALFSHELLTLWISEDFANHSAIFLQVFSLGVLINCLAQVAFSLIQSAGSAKLTAQAHIIELPFFLAALWILTSTYGNLGALIAWLMRITLDAVLMFTMSSRVMEKTTNSLINSKVILLSLLAVGCFAGVLMHPIAIRLLWATLIIVVSTSLLLRSWKKLHQLSMPK